MCLLLYALTVTKFQDLEQFTEHDAEEAIRRNNSAELQLVSVTVALASPDQCFAERVCVRLAAHRDANVRANAFISLGHLARRFRILDETTVKPLIEAGLRDPEEYVRANAKSAADEIHQFLHWKISGHMYG